MTRRFYVRATVAAATGFTAAFAAIAAIHPVPRVLWNASASAPLGALPDRASSATRRPARWSPSRRPSVSRAGWPSAITWAKACRC